MGCFICTLPAPGYFRKHQITSFFLIMGTICDFFHGYGGSIVQNNGKSSRASKTYRSKIRIHTKDQEIPIQVSWSKIHGLSDTFPLVFATTIHTKKEDYTKACEALMTLYGTDIPNKDWTRPLLRFIPLSMLMGRV